MRHNGDCFTELGAASIAAIADDSLPLTVGVSLATNKVRTSFAKRRDMAGVDESSIDAK